MFMTLFWAVVFYSYFCHSFYTSVNHFWITDPFLWTENNIVIVKNEKVNKITYNGMIMFNVLAESYYIY